MRSGVESYVLWLYATQTQASLLLPSWSENNPLLLGKDSRNLVNLMLLEASCV